MCGTIPLNQLGTWAIDIQGNVTWLTAPSLVAGEHLVTIVRCRGGMPKFLFTDPWEPVEKR